MFEIKPQEIQHLQNEISNKSKTKLTSIEFLASGHVQLSTYTVFHEASAFQVKTTQFLDPEGKD